MPLSYDAQTWETLTQLLDELAALPSREHSAWLDRLPAHQRHLRADLERLFGALSASDALFDEPAHVLLPADVTFSTLQAGHRFGPWVLVEEIGRGGMGTVWRAARSDGNFTQHAALKVIRTALDSPHLRHRFKQERQLLAQLQHPNIATLLDGGVTDDGVPWLAMELVDGTPITNWCDAHQLGIRERIALLRQVCGAVQHAHRALIVHRDLKPGNILVTGEGITKLLDFGIAKVLDDAETSDELATRPGNPAGTPAYLAPELLRGEPVSTAVDVYALGIIGHELLAGQQPFPTSGRSSNEWRRDVLERDPPPLAAAISTAIATARGERSVRTMRRVLTGDVALITAMALRKEPERRYASAEQLSEDLDRYLRGLPVVAQTDSLRYRWTKFVGRNRATVAAAAIAILAVLAGLGGTIWQARVARGERDRARLEAARTLRVSQFMEGTFRSADPRSLGKDITVASALGAAVRRANAELGGDPAILAGVLASIGRTYLGLGRYAEADSALRRALALERQTATGAATSLPSALRNLAALEAERGNIPAAESLLTEALARTRQPPTDSLNLAGALDSYGSLQLDKGEFANAERTLREALDVRKRLLGDRSPDVAGTLNNLGVALGQQNRWSEAIPLHLEALSILRQANGNEDPDVATGLNTLANAYTVTRNFVAADTLFEQALAQRIRLLGPHHPEVAWTHYSYADMLRLSGNHARALTEAQGVLAERGLALPETHPMVSSALHVYGRSLLALGRQREAEAALRESLRLRQLAYPAGHWLIASAAGAVGECLLAEDQFAAAERFLDEAYRGMKAAKGESDNRTRELAVALGRAKARRVTATAPSR